MMMSCKSLLGAASLEMKRSYLVVAIKPPHSNSKWNIILHFQILQIHISNSIKSELQHREMLPA